MEHRNLPVLYDVIDSPSQLYLVMEHVTGINLARYLRRDELNLEYKSEPLQELRAVLIMRQVLEGLAFMHKRQICHRDIKLDNLIICE